MVVVMLNVLLIVVVIVMTCVIVMCAVVATTDVCMCLLTGVHELSLAVSQFCVDIQLGGWTLHNCIRHECCNIVTVVLMVVVIVITVWVFVCIVIFTTEFCTCLLTGVRVRTLAASF
jgi:hypothetical protein